MSNIFHFKVDILAIKALSGNRPVSTALCAVPAQVVFNRDLFVISVTFVYYLTYQQKDKYFVVLPMLI